MIPKIICFIFGHKIREKRKFNYRGWDGSGYTLFSWEWEYYYKCPRCDVELKNTDSHEREKV